MNSDLPFFDSHAAAESIRIISRLREQGFIAYLAGGCVRDALLGLVPKDYDVATDATPDAVRDCFGRKRTLAFGASFGVIGVLPDRGKSQVIGSSLVPTEVATFRSDGEYSDGRRPDSVHFGSAEQDALRRDFTINGLFYDPLERRVIDFVDGQSDLHRGVLRTIGSAPARFGEDKLRMLRAVRFATTLEITIEPATLAAIQHHASDIHVVSGERIGAEMRRVLAAPRAAIGLQHLSQTGLAQHVLAEWEHVDQAQVAARLHCLAQRSESTTVHERFCTSLASLLLDHADATASLKAIADRWKLANDEQRPIAFTLQHWRDFVDAAESPWSRLQPLLVNRDRDIALATAHAFAQANDIPLAGIQRCQEAMSWPLEKLDPPPLLSGEDLQRLGIKPGPIFSKILKQLRAAQLDGLILGREDAQALVVRHSRDL